MGQDDPRRALGRPPAAPEKIEEPAEAEVKQEIIRQQEDEDPALAAYNRYLARLNSEGGGRP